MTTHICNKKGTRKGCETCGHGKPHKPEKIYYNYKCDQDETCFGNINEQGYINVKCEPIKTPEK